MNHPDTVRLGTLVDVSLVGTRIIAVWSGGSNRYFVGNSVIAIWQVDDKQGAIGPTYTAIVDNNSSTAPLKRAIQITVYPTITLYIASTKEDTA